MIEYHYELPFELENEASFSKWIAKVVAGEGQKISLLSYVFCTDEYLLELNRQFLDHDTLTDILTFPYKDPSGIKGEVYISVNRVRENAKELNVEFTEELKRVMIHGVLHLLGYTDGTKEEKEIMRRLEDVKIDMFHVEQ